MSIDALGCLIKCSNVYVDDNGRELVSPLEYETIGLLGTNCGLTEPDDVARLNETANDLGVDSIELGATIAVLMEAGDGAFGDLPFMQACLEEIRSGSEKGRFYATGTARVGAAISWAGGCPWCGPEAAAAASAAASSAGG